MDSSIDYSTGNSNVIFVLGIAPIMADLHTIDPGDMRAPEVGETVGDFTLDSTYGRFTLSERVRDGPVLLYFYVIDFGKTCTDYIATMNERVEDFRRMGVTMVHVNDDTVANHLDWARHTDSQFEVLADTGAEVSRDFGCIVTKARSPKILGRSNRGFFLIDGDMRVRYRWLADMPNDTIPMDALLEDVGRALAQ